MSLLAQDEGGGELRRWSASLALVLAAHGVAMLGFWRWQRPLDGAPVLPPAMMIDLPAASPAPSPVLPAPEPPPPLEAKELLRELELPPPDPAEPVTAEELLEKLELPEVPQVVEPEVVVPPPTPLRKPTPPRRAEQEVPPAKPIAAPPSPPQPAPADAVAAAPTPTIARPPVDRRLRFQALLLAHLERHMRYPRTAQMRNQHGTAHLRLVMDRSGRVIEAMIARSAGYAVLDREALATVERAQPLPAMPAELGLDRLDVIVPMEFKLRAGG
jgi:protein TonB